jgi:hypothetical protein
VVEVPDPAVAVVFETGSPHGLQISDENLGRSGADVDAVDEVDVVASGGRWKPYCRRGCDLGWKPCRRDGSMTIDVG